jgi:hypothetical protein
MLAWRYGGHSVVRTRRERETLTPYEGGAEVRREYLANLRARAAQDRIPAAPAPDLSDPEAAFMAHRQQRSTVVQQDSDDDELGDEDELGDADEDET